MEMTWNSAGLSESTSFNNANLILLLEWTEDARG